MGYPIRENSATMTQNVGLKGRNDENIFFDEEDREEFLNSMARASAKSGVEVAAWALMDNHVHMIMHGDIDDFSSFFQSALKTYQMYFGEKYEVTGKIWNSRYYAKGIETVEQYRQAVAYVFNNPVAAGIVKSPEESRWTNYAAVKNGQDRLARELIDEVVDCDHVIEFTDAYSKAKLEAEQEKELEIIPRRRLFDSAATREIKKIIEQTEIKNVPKLKEKKQRKVVTKLLELGASYNQIKRLTSLTRPMITRLMI